MAKKEIIRGGLSGLLSAAPQAKAEAFQATEQEAEYQPATRQLKSQRGTTVRVCYNLNSELVQKAKAIAYYDRKNINEVFNEALQAYIKKWKPTEQKPPQF